MQGNFRAARFMPPLSDNDLIGQWAAQGSKGITQRAFEHARTRPTEHCEPSLDVATNGARLDDIARRERDIPAADALSPED